MAFLNCWSWGVNKGDTVRKNWLFKYGHLTLEILHTLWYRTSCPTLKALFNHSSWFHLSTLSDQTLLPPKITSQAQIPDSNYRERRSFLQQMYLPCQSLKHIENNPQHFWSTVEHHQSSLLHWIPEKVLVLTGKKSSLLLCISATKYYFSTFYTLMCFLPLPSNSHFWMPYNRCNY